MFYQHIIVKTMTMYVETHVSCRKHHEKVDEANKLQQMFNLYIVMRELKRY